jgi:hypothetical protein
MLNNKKTNLESARVKGITLRYYSFRRARALFLFLGVKIWQV